MKEEKYTTCKKQIKSKNYISNQQNDKYSLVTLKIERPPKSQIICILNTNEKARTPKNTGTLKNIGKFPSLKNKKSIWFESHIERDFIYLIEFDEDVIKYREQPFKIQYFLNGKQHYYTPDFLVKRKKKKQIIEIKPQSKIEKVEFIHFSKHMNKLLAEEGYEYLIITDLDIRLQPRLSNIKFLWRYSRIPISTAHQILVQRIFAKSSNISFSKLSSIFSQSKQQREIIFTLIFHQYLLIDIDKPITPDSVISIGNIFN